MILGSGAIFYEKQLLQLRQRLLYAEKENKKRSHELNSALNEIIQVIGKAPNMSINVAGLCWTFFLVTVKFTCSLKQNKTTRSSRSLALSLQNYLETL